MGLFYFFLFFNMKGKLYPKVFWATPTPILPSPHPFPCCCFSESWNSSPHISISPLKPSFLVWVYPRLKQLSPKLPPRPLTRAAGWFWNWKWGILVPIEYRSETPKLGLTSMCCWSRSLVATVHGIAESDTTEATGHACTLHQLTCRRFCPLL